MSAMKPEVKITFKQKWMAEAIPTTTPTIFDRGLDMALPTQPDIDRHRKLKCRHETGSGNNFLMETDGEAIPMATNTFSTMPNLDMSLRHGPTSTTSETFIY